MKKLILFLIFQSFCWTTGFSENPRWKVFGTPIPPRVDLNVRWDAPTNEFPPRVWVCRLLPNKFSPQVISNLMDLCLFTEKDKKEQSTKGVTFQNPDGSRKLSVSFPSGAILYQTPDPDYGPTNLAAGVPTMNQMPELATNVFQKIGINLSDLTGYSGTSKFHVGGPETLFFVNDTTITNIAYRTVHFRRSVDEMPVSGGDGGGIDFGEHGKIRRISISWRNLERIKSCPTYSAETVVRSLREGKALQGLVPSNFGGIDWPTVKSVTVKKASPCYCSGNSDLLYPFLALSATVDTGRGKVDVEIDCPIIDETESSDAKNTR
jgi:hypothetical protein